MDGLKRKVVATNQDIERAENKERYIRKLLRLTSERAVLAEMEADGLKNRIKEIERQIEKANEKGDNISVGVHAKESEADDSEKERKVMESKEYDHSDQIALLDVRVQDMVRVVDEKEIRLEEAKLRNHEGQVSLRSALQTANAAESKIVHLEEEIESMCQHLYQLERKGDKLFKRKEYFERKIDDLEHRHRSALVRADESQQDSKILQMQRDRLHNEVTRERKRVAFLKRELEDAVADLNQE